MRNRPVEARAIFPAVDLKTIRSRLGAFHPPQFFKRLSSTEVAALNDKLALTNERKRDARLQRPEKYEPLWEYLAALPPTTNETTLSFEQVAQIIDDSLPPSATTYREWWSNQEGGSRAPHWRAAGFKVDHADTKRQVVRFKRIAPAKELPRALTLREVVTEVNERAHGHPFGGLPEWRKLTRA